MGLDMYLNRRRYVQRWDHIRADQQFEVTLTRGGKPLELENPSYIIEQVGYWRKANAIHRWFVQNVQDGVDDCREAYVDIEQLKALRDVVEEVLNDHSKAELLLPTGSGFFFGPTEYDEWYFEDLKSTVEIIDKVLAFEESIGEDYGLSGDYYYQSSW